MCLNLQEHIAVDLYYGRHFRRLGNSLEHFVYDKGEILKLFQLNWSVH